MLIDFEGPQAEIKDPVLLEAMPSGGGSGLYAAWKAGRSQSGPKPLLALPANYLLPVHESRGSTQEYIAAQCLTSLTVSTAGLR